jgi:hypothetical protein
MLGVAAPTTEVQTMDNPYLLLLLFVPSLILFAAWVIAVFAGPPDLNRGRP